MRIDFWQIEAERAGDTQSYAVPSISKNREKCGRGLVGHGSSIDVIYIGGAQAGAGGASQMAHFEIFCFCQLAAEKEGLSGENWRLPQTRDRKVTIYEICHLVHSYQGRILLIPTVSRCSPCPP